MKQVNVLMTGFGPFRSTVKNPSWEAVKLVGDRGVQCAAENKTVQVDIAYIPVEYAYIQDALPYYHGNKTQKRELKITSAETSIGARDDFDQQKRYDLILHVGQGRPGGIRLETIAHQAGYRLEDVESKFASMLDDGVRADDEDASRPEQSLSVSERGVGMDRGYILPKDVVVSMLPHCALETDLDTLKLAETLRSRLPEITIDKSKNAGRYLCEFIFFGSLAEAAISQVRSARLDHAHEPAKVLFVHVPPAGSPLQISQMADVLCALVEEISLGLKGGRMAPQ